jgi:hypothetical protein
VLQNTAVHVLQNTAMYVLQNTATCVLQNTAKYVLQNMAVHVMQNTAMRVAFVAFITCVVRQQQGKSVCCLHNLCPLKQKGCREASQYYYVRSPFSMSF